MCAKPASSANRICCSPRRCPTAGSSSTSSRWCRARPQRSCSRDDGELGVAERAAQRLAAIGYTDVAVVDGGNKAWAAAGHALFAGVNVPSKTFGELVEHAYHTPRITAQELVRMKEAGEDFVLFDGRPVNEHHKMTIPGCTCCPNAELPLRVPAMVKNPKTKIIVNCAGRTRSIIGAQTLINFGVPNPVYALENGTQGWYLSDLKLEYGSTRTYPEKIDAAALPAQQEAARKLMARFGIRTVSAHDVAAWLGETESHHLSVRRAHAGRIRGGLDPRRCARARRPTDPGHRSVGRREERAHRADRRRRERARAGGRELAEAARLRCPCARRRREIRAQGHARGEAGAAGSRDDLRRRAEASARCQAAARCSISARA